MTHDYPLYFSNLCNSEMSIFICHIFNTNNPAHHLPEVTSAYKQEYLIPMNFQGLIFHIYYYLFGLGNNFPLIIRSCTTHQFLESTVPAIFNEDEALFEKVLDDVLLALLVAGHRDKLLVAYSVLDIDEHRFGDHQLPLDLVNGVR